MLVSDDYSSALKPVTIDNVPPKKIIFSRNGCDEADGYLGVNK